MATRMQQRRGTESQWGTANPILAAGEIGFEIDTNKFKIGDGINHWDDLDYFTSSSELLAIVDGAPELLDTLNEIAAAIGDDPNFSSKVVPIVKKTTVQWTADTSAIAEGTLAYDTTTGKFKIGNGTDTWSNTSYLINALEMNESITSGITARIGSLTVTEAEYLSGATASIQGQLDDLAAADVSIQSELDDKAPTSNPTFTGTVVLPTSTSIGDVSSTELGYVNGVTSGIQTQLDAKLASATASSTYAPLSGPTFTGTVVLPSTTSIGDVSSTELGYVNGVTSAIQTQLDAKAPTADPTFTGTVSGVTKNHVGLGNVDNTSDANKPISTATQTALDAKASLSGATFTGDVEMDGNLVVDGNLTVNGTTFSASSTTIVIEDNLVQLAHQNAGNTVDLGIVVGYNDGATKHSGIVRDVSADVWKLFKGVSTEPTTTVAFGEGSLDNLELNNLTAAGVVFSDGTQTKQGVPSITTISAKTDSYTLSNLNERDTIVEINKSTATTLTIPTNASVAYPVGTTLDIIQTGTGQVTIAGAGGVTVNATPGLKLRTQWSSATLLKRAENTWLVYGDLTA
jgi:hypothetical protein